MGSFFTVLFGSAPLVTLSVTILTTLTMTLLFKTSTTANFAQGTLSVFGAYITTQILYDTGMNIWIALLISVVICFAIGLFIDLGVIRRGRMVNPIGKQMITMGFTYVLLGLIILIFPITVLEVKPSSEFISINKTFTIGNVTYPYNTIVCLAVSIVIAAVLFILLYKSKWGLGVRVTASNEEVAEMIGVDTHLISAISWSLAAGLGAIAATMINYTSGSLGTAMMTSAQLNAFIACVVGGFASFYGPLVAAVILWVITNMVAALGMDLSFLTAWKEVIVYVIAMMIVLWKPEGVFGKASVRKV